MGGFALPYDFLSIVIAGFFSCVALDMFGRLLLILFKIPEPSWDVVGRWFFTWSGKERFSIHRFNMRSQLIMK